MSCSGPDFFIKKGDRLPSITATLYNPDGTIADLMAATVAFKFRPKGGGVVTSGTAVVVSVNGKVRYDWGASDTTTSGDFDAEWVVTVGGKEQTFPSDDFIWLRITADVS